MMSSKSEPTRIPSAVPMLMIRAPSLAKTSPTNTILQMQPSSSVHASTVAQSSAKPSIFLQAPSLPLVRTDALNLEPFSPRSHFSSGAPISSSRAPILHAVKSGIEPSASPISVQSTSPPVHPKINSSSSPPKTTREYRTWNAIKRNLVTGEMSKPSLKQPVKVPLDRPQSQKNKTKKEAKKGLGILSSETSNIMASVGVEASFASNYQPYAPSSALVRPSSPSPHPSSFLRLDSRSSPATYPDTVPPSTFFIPPNVKSRTERSTLPSAVQSIPSRHLSSSPHFDSTFPSIVPTLQGLPASLPTVYHSSAPVSASVPTWYPSTFSSPKPSYHPSSSPYSNPIVAPSNYPRAEPTHFPSGSPLILSSVAPSKYPSAEPTRFPSGSPSTLSSVAPSKNPSAEPTRFPSGSPSILSSAAPSKYPSTEPTRFPSASPSITSSAAPSKYPSTEPTRFPSASPSITSSAAPSKYPSAAPTRFPSGSPSISFEPSVSQMPTTQPTQFFVFDQVSFVVTDVLAIFQLNSQELQNVSYAKSEKCEELWMDYMTQNIEDEVLEVISRYETLNVDIFNVSSAFEGELQRLSFNYNVKIDIRSPIQDHNFYRYIAAPIDSQQEKNDFILYFRDKDCPEFKNVRDFELILPASVIPQAKDNYLQIGLFAGVAAVLAIGAIAAANFIFTRLRGTTRLNLEEETNSPEEQQVDGATTQDDYYDIGVDTIGPVSSLGDPTLIDDGTGTVDLETIDESGYDFDLKMAYKDMETW